MKKSLIVSAALVAALALVSCSKESADSIALPEGKIVSFTLDVPGERDIADMDSEDVKISFGNLDIVNNKIPVYWNSGDAFRLFTCLSEDKYQITFDGEPSKATNIAITPNDVTDCGNFTTTADKVKIATFSGVIPSDAQSTTEGMAIFPAGAYKEGSARIAAAKNSGLVKGYIGCTTQIPAEQDGTGIKYLIATSRLKGGAFSKFAFSTNMVKISIPEDLGVDKVVLSAPTDYAKALGGSQISLYYYFGNSGYTLSNTSGQTWSITVSRDGEVLSGDVYFVTRSMDADVYLTLTFFKGPKISKQMRAKSKKLEGGKMVDYGTVTPVFPEQTVIEFDREALRTAKQQFVPKNDANEVFPYTAKSESITLPGASKATSFYHLSNVAGGSSSSFTELNYQWYNEEHTYTCGGYDWVFGSTKEFTSLTNVTEIGADANKGMYYYTSNGGYYLRMDQGAYLKTPVITGKKLVGISISIANSSNSLWWRLSKTAAAAADDRLLNDNDIKMNKDSGLLYFYLDGTEKDTSYYFISNGGLQPVKIILYYQ